MRSCIQVVCIVMMKAEKSGNASRCRPNPNPHLRVFIQTSSHLKSAALSIVPILICIRICLVHYWKGLWFVVKPAPLFSFPISVLFWAAWKKKASLEEMLASACGIVFQQNTSFCFVCILWNLAHLSKSMNFLLPLIANNVYCTFSRNCKHLR